MYLVSPLTFQHSASTQRYGMPATRAPPFVISASHWRRQMVSSALYSIFSAILIVTTLWVLCPILRGGPALFKIRGSDNVSRYRPASAQPPSMRAIPNGRGRARANAAFQLRAKHIDFLVIDKHECASDSGVSKKANPCGWNAGGEKGRLSGVFLLGEVETRATANIDTEKKSARCGGDNPLWV